MMRLKLPGGFPDETGRIRRDAEIRPLTGREEEVLAGGIEGPEAVTEVLGRCLVRLGSANDPGPDGARKLLVADRQYLLLRLREISFGPDVFGSLWCPWPDCGERVDVEFSLSLFPVKEAAEEGPVYRMSLSEEAAEGEDRSLEFRLPVGEDQEVLYPLYLRNEAEALSALLARCLVGESATRASRLSSLARYEIEKRMEEVAPAVDLEMESVCSRCGRSFRVPFQLQDFFFGELRTGEDLLRREVHYLAWHYHWSESEIMGLTKEKRRKYIETLSDEVTRMNRGERS